MLLNLKFIGTLKKILLWVLIAILAIPVAGYLALQFPQAQTYVTQKVIGSLSDKKLLPQSIEHPLLIKLSLPIITLPL